MNPIIINQCSRTYLCVHINVFHHQLGFFQLYIADSPSHKNPNFELPLSVNPSNSTADQHADNFEPKEDKRIQKNLRERKKIAIKYQE